MANDISGRTWRIDTLPFSYPYQVKLKSIQWTDQAAAGDQLVVKTVSGLPIIDSKAQQANYQQNFGEMGYQPSLAVTTLTSGVVIINPGSNK